MTDRIDQAIAELLAPRDVDPQRLRDPSFDLLDSGILDSIGLLELVAEMEKKIGIHVDLFDVNPERLSTVGGLHEIFQEAADN